MKKRLLLLFSLISIFILSSCDLQALLNANDIYGHTLEYDISDAHIDQINQFFDSVSTNIAAAESFDDIYEIYYTANGYMKEVATYANIEHVKFAMDGNKASEAKYLEYQAWLNDLTRSERNMLLAISQTSYKDKFFEDMTEKEIDDLTGIKLNDRFYELENETEKLVTKHEGLSRQEVYAAADEDYITLVNMNNEMATIAGYSNYLEYAYKNIYDRDYTVADAKSFTNYVGQYLIEDYYTALSGFQRQAQLLSSKNQTVLSKIMSSSYKNTMNYFDEYAKYLGGTYYTFYNQLWNNGYYYFSNNTNAVEGAYTTYLYTLETPMVYFGPGYQDIYTLVHEFGHYYAMKSHSSGISSFDLAESHSQGNEMLFTAYLYKTNKLSDATYSCLENYKMADSLSTIIIGSVMNALEEYAYTTPNVTAQMIDDECERLFDENFGGYERFTNTLGITPKQYWRLVLLQNAGYYISYAVSQIAALEIYAQAKIDFDDASNKYQQICNFSPNNQEFTHVIVKSGLTNPLSLDSILVVADIIE